MSRESDLMLEQLRLANPIGIHDRFTSYLSPILIPSVDVVNIDDLTSFKKFLKDCLRILGTRLSQPKKFKYSKSILNEFFEVYKLCLRSHDAIIFKLGNLDEHPLESYLRFIRCLDVHRRADDLEIHGLDLLEKLDNNIELYEDVHCDVLKACVRLLKISQKSTTTDDEHCKKLLNIMEKAKTWKRFNCEECEELHIESVTILCSYGYNLCKKSTFSDIDSGMTLCRTVLNECMQTPAIKIQVYKVSNKMCSNLFELTKNHSYVIEILDCIAPSSVEAEEVNSGVEFVKTVYQCATQCCTPQVRHFCAKLETYINRTANNYTKVKAPIESLLRIIAKGLHLVNFHSQVFEDLLQALFKNDKILQKSLHLFISMITHIQRHNKPFTVDDQSLQDQSLDYETSMAYLSPSISSLSLLCHVLSKSVRKSGWTHQFLTRDKVMLTTVVDMFHVNCRLILTGLSITSKKKRDEKSWLVEVVCGTFSIGIITKLKLQESIDIIKEIFVSNWIQNEEMKKLINWLNLGTTALQENNKKKQVLSLRCEVFWLFVKSHPGNLSQDALERYSLDTYTKSCTLLNLLHDTNYSEMKKKVTGFLEEWSTVRDQLKTLPTPVDIVKTWVECRCKHQLKHDKDDSFDSLTLHDLLSSSSSKVSKRNIGILLEQEYNAYENANEKLSSFCHNMRLKIVSLFMSQIYTTDEIYFQKTKAQPQRPPKGNSHVDNEATQCLRAAIKIMETISSNEKMSSEANPLNHQLYVAYCLRSLCKLEANPYLERTFEDPKALTESIMIMIYNVFDILQLKGWNISSITGAYELLIKMQNLMNFPSEKQLTLLWESRRLSHPTCISPLNWSFVQQTLHTSDLKEIETCIDCLKKNNSGFQQNFFFLFENSHTDAVDHHRCFKTDISDKDIKEVAWNLSSKDPADSHSTFLAGYLYHGLCQRLIANGKLMEALLLAKEAHRLHSTLFNNMFNNGSTETIDFTTTNLWEMIISGAEDVLPFSSSLRDSEKAYISPWKILQCYLESTLQVGTIYEMIGDGTEAVAHLQLGRKIASKVNSPLFIVAFSSLLGKLYAQQQNLELAENELQLALHLLKNREEFGCSKCKLVLEATVIEYVADLRQENPDAGKKIVLRGNLYELALQKLTNSEWTNSITGSNYRKLISVECSCSGTIENKRKSRSDGSENMNEEKAEKSPKRARQTGSLFIHEPQKSTKRAREAGSLVNQGSDKCQVLQTGCCTTYSTCLKECKFYDMGCWHCLPSKVVKSGLLSDLINLKWEYVRRKKTMNLLSRSGKCFANSNKTDELQKSLLRRISVLVGKNAFQYTFSSIAPHHFRHLVKLGTPNDIFAIERAEIVHDICWYVMKDYHSDSVRKIFLNQSSITLKEITSWLIQAFVRSGDVPIVSQKVSELLIVIYQICLSEQCSWLPWTTKLSTESWAFFFHQASIGRHVSSQFLSDAFKGPNFDESSYIKAGTVKLLRLPERIEDLEKHVIMFLAGLPSTTIVCISVLGHEYSSLLKKLCPSTCIEAWMLISRCSVGAEHVVELVPLNPISGDMSFKYKKTTKLWVSPWGNGIVDKIAPSFKNIVQQYFYMLRQTLSSDSHKGSVMSEAKSFDKRLGTLLRSIEKWFDSSKCLLLKEALEPITLVLGYEVQMLPWEKLSSLRNKEVYRMPSVNSICILLDKCNNHKEEVENKLFPSIDPLRGYFVLNPDGSLSKYETTFADYFKKMNLQGTTKSEPTIKELVVALQSHDTYIYFGHGSGKQYIPNDIIKKLRKCSAAFLMGCSSNCLTLQGCYAPIGTPLSYLRAGSPIIVGNLWIMIESEICLFAQTLFEEILNDLEHHSESDRRKIGAFAVKARSSFTLPFMSRASLVCYGLPVGIHNSKARGI